MDGLKIPRHILATLRAKLDPLIGHFLRIADQSMISVLQLYLVACLTDTHEHCEEIANILHK